MDSRGLFQLLSHAGAGAPLATQIDVDRLPGDTHTTGKLGLKSTVVFLVYIDGWHGIFLLEKRFDDTINLKAI